MQLKAEVQKLLALAKQADGADIPDGVSLPDEIKRREDRVTAMADAKRNIAARAEARFQREKADYEEKMARRAAKEKEAGKKLGGKPPKAPEPGPRASDQINLKDEESRIMPVAGGGYEQAYNAQATADVATTLVFATHVTQAPNDKEQVIPMLALMKAQLAVIGMPTCVLAYTGYFSEKNDTSCKGANIVPLIAVACDQHHPDWRERHSEPAPLPAGASVVQTITHTLKTKAKRAKYALRKQTIEPVFGIIKSVLGSYYLCKSRIRQQCVDSSPPGC